MKINSYERQESYIYRNGILPLLNKEDCYVERIENSISQGMPDIFILSKGATVFAELKADAKNWMYIRPWQFNKLNKYEKYGARAIIIRAHFVVKKGKFNETLQVVTGFSFYKAPLNGALKDAQTNLTIKQKETNPTYEDDFKYERLLKITTEPYAHLKLGDYDSKEFYEAVFGIGKYGE